MTPDSLWIRRCLEGDRAAWSALLARYANLAYALLRRAGLDAHAADDAFQEVAVLLWRHLPRLRDEGRLASWIGTTARRVAWRSKSRSRRRSEREAAASRPDRSAAPAPDVAAGTAEQEQAMREALADLGPRCREILSLLYFQSVDCSYDEAARRLGMPRGSLGPTRQRCLDALREGLEARGLAPGVSESGPRGSADSSSRSRRTESAR